jgi:hypothetical protein
MMKAASRGAARTIVNEKFTPNRTMRFFGGFSTI